MTTTITIPIIDPRKPPKLVFPERCLNCSQPKQEQMNLGIPLAVQSGQNQKMVTLNIPLCKVCAARERQVTLVTLVPFLVGGFLVGLVVFIPVVLLAPEGTTSQTVSLPWVLGGAAGLTAGIIAGTVVEFVVKLLATPFFGALLKRPLTAFSVFADTENVLGLQARLINARKALQLTFERDDVAQEFRILNNI